MPSKMGLLITCCALVLSACGGGSSQPPGANPDFTISVSPGTVTGSAGGNSTQTMVSVSGLNGFSGNVIFSITGLLPGSSTTPAQPFAVAAGSGQALSVSIPAGTASGNVALTVTGTSGLISHSAALILSVGSGGPDFSLSVNPGTISAAAGGTSNSTTVSVVGSGGFAGNVSVAVSGLPPGGTTTPAQPFSIAAGGSQQLAVNVPAGTASGSFGLILSGTSGSLVHTASLVLNVSGTGSDQMVVVGHTDSGNFPTTPGAPIATPQGGGDGLVASARLAGGAASSTFSTYFGGNGAEQVRDVFVDSQGNIYITGQTVSTNLAALMPPAATAGVLRASCACATQPDAFVAKFAPTGQILRFTYLGGSGHDEGYSIFVDAAGFIYVGGRTSSTDYPVTAGTAQTSYGGGGFDFHVTKLAPDLSAIVWATYLGGSGEDTGRGRLGVDSAGNVYIGGETRSNDFPGAAGLLTGARDGVVVKLSPTGTLLYSRLIGGNEPAGSGEGMTGDLLVKSSGETYVCGFSSASNIPNVIRPFGGGQSDAVIARLDSSGQILAITYLGGNNLEECEGLALDAAGNLVVATLTGSTAGFPTTAGAFQTAPQGGLDFGITKLSANLSAIVFSTFVGGAGNEDADTVRVGLDPNGNIYFAGYTASAGIPWITANAVQRIYGGGSHDVLLFVLSADGRQILYASYLGGSGDDIARSMRYHRNP